MDEFDDLTEEELKLAAEFAEALEDGRPEAESNQLRPLMDTAALVSSTERWELSSTALWRGRKEVEEQAATQGARGPRSERPRVRWLVWLALPALAVFALVAQLSPQEGMEETASSAAPRAADSESEEAAPAAQLATAPASPVPPAAAPEGPEEGFEKVEPRFHAGQIPPSLLTAQAVLLAERAPGEARKNARVAFEREMRTYRGQLIASLEVGGR